MAITITTEQQVKLHVAAVTPRGLEPAAPPVVWTLNHPTKLALVFPQGDTFTAIAIGLAVQAGCTATATDDNGNDTVFTIDVVSPDATDLTGASDLPELQSDKGQNRGRGLGLGYQ